MFPVQDPRPPDKHPGERGIIQNSYNPIPKCLLTTIDFIQFSIIINVPDVDKHHPEVGSLTDQESFSSIIDKCSHNSYLPYPADRRKSINTASPVLLTFLHQRLQI